MELAPKQQEAIDACCDIANRVVAVSGAAGTGKTTILRQVYAALKDAGYNIALCSPTGKAAKRIYEATGINALTIHKLLEFSHPGDPDPKTGKPIGFSAPKRDRQNRLEYDVILADEYAMVGHDLHRCLFDALPSGGRVCCFGDENQLAPIEEDKRYESEPSPFQKLLNDPKNFRSIILDTVFRQGQDSGILLNANNILKSKMPTRNDQWSQMITDQPIDALRKLIEEVDFERDGADNQIRFDTIENQVLVPQNKSWVGTAKINLIMQSMYHTSAEPRIQLPRKPWVEGADGEKGSHIWVYKGDKVICTTNNYELGVMNGETGTIIELDTETGEIVIDFGDREQSIPPVLMVQNKYGKLVSIDPRKEFDLAYAITVHKAQGSEYKHVIYILNRSNMFMINRRNFYTAITRAKEHVHLIADQQGLSNAVYRKDQIRK